MNKDSEIATNIFEKYNRAYNNEIQGCCLLIADEIHSAIGGEIVAGELTWYGGSCRRTHWWIEKDGEIFDPMGDDILKYEKATARIEEHRNPGIFRNLLSCYECWRVKE